MKLLKALLVINLLMGAAAFAGTASEADQKWLEVVKKKVAVGETQVSTPVEARVALLREWSAKNGYAANVVKTDAGFRVELTKTVAHR
jgi:hypothetical protein